MYEELVKSLRWLGFMFPETHPARDDADRISNNIHLDCTQAADAIEELQAQLMFSNDAAKAIAEKVPKWIPVEERLPEEDAICILTNGVSNAIGYRGKVFGFHLIWTDYLNGSEVTHWMPLPEPPTAEEGET